MQLTIDAAKEALDTIIKKARVQFYKPMQVAEVLYHSRVHGGFDVSDKETYRKESKHWRDPVSLRLVGRVSTSTAKFQDDVFSDTAMPVSALVALDEENKATGGAVEKYIYLRFGERQAMVLKVLEYLQNSTKATFRLSEYLSYFEGRLKTSVDKAYEITVYALFSTVVEELRATVTLTAAPSETDLLREFDDFARMLLGITSDAPSITLPARLYRVGVTNAADTGLDVWTNFGPAVQVKHVALSVKLAEGAATEVQADHLVLVCTQAEKHMIANVMSQIGWGERIRGIITEDDLNAWYERCVRGRFSERLGDKLIVNLIREYRVEFPHMSALADFLNERRYLDVPSPHLWSVE